MKINQINNFETPQNKTQVMEFVGMVKQLNSWTRKLSHLTNNMRNLAGKNTHFLWTDVHEEEFRKCKAEIVREKFISPFDANNCLILYTNTSKIGGLGYALLQWRNKEEDDKEKDEEDENRSGAAEKHLAQYNVIQMSSTLITDTHRWYLVPELELLGVVFALKHCKYYTLGAEGINIRLSK